MLFYRLLLEYFLISNVNYWIGLRDKGNNRWHWINGGGQVNNEIWNENEPDNRSGGKNEDCAALTKRTSRFLADDLPCGQLVFGICEKPEKEN